ncbi:MAG: FliH/SctL family protein [Anaerolineaceae bacterium]|nr:FliH/SctL family protein [Anaerolineaceae bacterium]
MRSSPEMEAIFSPLPWIPVELNCPKDEAPAPSPGCFDPLAPFHKPPPDPALASPAEHCAELQHWSPAPVECFPTITQPLWPEMRPERPGSERTELEPGKAEAQATQMLEEAQAQANALVEAAQAQAAEINRQAHQDGWESAQAEAEGQLNSARVVMEQAAVWRDELLGSSESIVLKLVRTVAQKMFGEGLELDSQNLQRNFNRVLDDARALGDLVLYVHPSDAANLSSDWRELQISVSGRKLQIIPSDAIRQGGCFIDGELGTVDARIETQLKAIMDTLNEGESAEEGLR